MSSRVRTGPTPVQSESVLCGSAHDIEVEGSRGSYCGGSEGGHWGPLAVTSTGYRTHLDGEKREHCIKKTKKKHKTLYFFVLKKKTLEKCCFLISMFMQLLNL